jgi:hypothetical protein
VVATVDAVPSDERVAPKATVAFTARMPSHPEVRRYHVEAVGR